MNNFSLDQRFRTKGTLFHPDGIPDPRFALPSTVNWMRSLALLVEDQKLNFANAQIFYKHTSQYQHNDKQQNSILEQLVFSLHQLSALKSMLSLPSKADIARVAIVAWYYGIYSAASAMVTAKDGSLQNTHTKTAAAWDRQCSYEKLVMAPFSLRVSTLVKKDYEQEIDILRSGNNFKLINTPTNPADAHASNCAYLKGTADRYREEIEKKVKKSNKLNNFLSKKAKGLRDAQLTGKSVSFIHQAIRYRGKSNYREALFLAYGNHIESIIIKLINDLSIVLESFTAMTGAYVSYRLKRTLWSTFLDDLEKKRSFTLSPHSVWPS